MRDINGSWHLRLLCRDVKDYLYELNPNPILVEIGSYEGESTEIFAQEFPFATIYAIDPWVNGYDNLDPTSNADMIKVEQNFDKRIKYYENIIKIKDFSTNVIIENVDMIYIDGNHQYEFVKNDIIHWSKYLKDNGIYSGHDYYENDKYPHVAGVKKAILEMLGKPNKIYADGSWIITKK